LNTNNISTSIDRAKRRRNELTDALFTRPESLSSLLPYNEYLGEHRVFVMKDGSLGAFLEMELKEHEAMTEKEILEVISALKAPFQLPESCVLQVLFDQMALSPFDESLNRMEREVSGENEVAKKLYSIRVEAIKKGCQDGGLFRPYKRRAYLSLRYFPKELRRGGGALSRGEAVLFQEMKGFVRCLQDFRHILAGLEANSQVKLRRLEATDLLDLLRRFFNPKTYYKRPFAPFNEARPLSEQFLYNAPALDYPGMTREGVKTRTITLKTSPQYAYPGGMAYFTKIAFPFVLSLNFSFPSKGKVKRFFDMKEFFLQNTPSAKANLQREEVLAVQERLARDDRCLLLTFCVIVEGETDEELDEKTRAICQVFNNDLECEVIVEEDIGLGLALNALPLNYTPDSDYSARRAIRILRSDVQNFVPVFDSFRGMKSPLSIHLSREGNLVPFSLLENETSNHTVVLADSGSGKSAFVIDCLLAAKRLSPDPLIFIVDKKSSYAMLAEYFDGEITVFDRDKEIPFSPFRGNYDEEKIAFLTKLIISAISLTSPSFNVESEHQAAIAKALKLAYVKKCQRAGITYIDGELLKHDAQGEVVLTMDDFVAELGNLTDDRQESLQEMIGPLIAKLRPFYGDGIYARFFRGGADGASTKKRFVIYDLDALDGDPVLQTLMTMAVTEEIRRVLNLPDNRGRQAFVVFEEFAMLGRNNPGFRDFAIDFAETMRKRGAWLITLTPRPQNYFELEVGKAFWSVADNYLFLQMNSDNVDYLAEKSSLLDQANKEIIRSLKTKRGQFAEVFYMNKKKTRQGAFRFIQTPLERWLAPTNARDAREADRALSKFEGRKWEALQYLAEKFPNGTEVSR